MKKLALLLILFLSFTVQGQLTLSSEDARPSNVKDEIIGSPKTAACGTPWVSSGYPNWTNYWGGYQFNIVNLSGGDIIIHSFEARFQGTAGYRIYTKTGTFIGFETNAAAWTLVGSIPNGLTGLSTTAPTPIPITVDVCIPAGATQGFYLTRTNNNAANRHLYIVGSGTAGTTIYASDANLGITEAYYVSPFFAALYTQTRRPSLDVCYSVGCSPLPVELVKFEGYNENHKNILKWHTVSEINNDHFVVERSVDGINFERIGTMDGMGNSTELISYKYNDLYYIDGTTNYYRLKQVDYDGKFEYSDVIAIDNSESEKKVVKTFNVMGQEVDKYYRGFVFEQYDDGTTKKIIR